MTKRRIAVAGFQHETNTFAPGRAGIEEFTMDDSWPGLLKHQQVIEKTQGLNLPLAGAVSIAQQHNIELLPIVWCAAEPSGPVTKEAFEWISGMITTAIAEAGHLDAIYLDLHGAMVTEHFDDGEGELLRRLRSGPASGIPIGVSLDLHANISQQLVNDATVISIFRTYPHLDMAESGARCMQMLLQVIKGAKVCSAFRQSPFLVPLHAQYTGEYPCNDLYKLLDALVDNSGYDNHNNTDKAKEITSGRSTIQHLELAMGFTAADIPDCGPSIVAHAGSDAEAASLADAMFQKLIAAEPEFDTTLQSADQSVQQAIQRYTGKPIVIADVQDNAGAGGTADTTGLLQALVNNGAQNAVLGVICDSEVAALAHKAGAEQKIRCALGAKSGLAGHRPFNGEFIVEGLSDGNIAFTGEMYRGVTACVGKSCLLRFRSEVADVQIVVSSTRTQCLDQAFFTHFGIDLTAQKIICVKSTVHFRADFTSIAGCIINAKAPGAFACDLHDVQYQHLRSGIRTGSTSES